MYSPPHLRALPGHRNTCLEAVDDGPRSAFYQQELRRALSFARSRVRRDHAEDLVHEAFARMLDYWSELPEAARRRWFYRVLRNLVVDVYRARRVCSGLEDWDQTTPSPAPGPLESLLRDEREAAVHGAIAMLPLRMRRTLELRMAESATYAELADDLDCAERTVSTRIFRARTALAERLRRVD